MAELGGRFNFFRSIHVRIDIRIDISISRRPMTTKFGKQVTSRAIDSNEINQAVAGEIIMSRSRDFEKIF